MTTELPFRVTDACNAHCTFCEEHVPRATADLGNGDIVVALAAALEHHRLTRGGPASLLRLLGGEPLLQRRLPAMIEHAVAAGVAEVWLDTNGFALNGTNVVERLRSTGLTGVRIGVFGSDDAAVDARMRRPGGAALMRNGLRAAIAGGLRVELAVLALPEPLSELPALLDALAAEGSLAGVTALWVHPYRSRDAAHALLHPLPRSLEPTLQSLAKKLTSLGIALRTSPELAWHPCAFARPRPLAALVRGTATGAVDRFVHLAPCANCALRPRCDGVERSLAAAHGAAVVFAQEDGRRALWAGVQERTRHSARTDRVDVRDGSALQTRRREHVIRVNHACNQRCRFCWVDFEAGELTVDAVRAAVVDALAISGDPSQESIAFTGGEPTLRADLPELIAIAKAAGAGRVHLQTNAVRLADGDLAARLAAAGLSEALVSLHADQPGASDEITALPGSFERTLLGIGNLLGCGVDVVVNHVLTRDAAPRFIHFVERLAALDAARAADAECDPTRATGTLTLTVAVASHIDRGPLDPEVLPTHSELAPHVRRGLLRARQLGLCVRDLAHPCGFALCVLDPELEALDVALLRQVPTAGRLGEAEGCVKPAAICGGCAMEPYCFGLRAEYAAAHGIAELRPFAPAVGVVGLGKMGERYLHAARELGARVAVVARHAADRARVPDGPAAVVADAAHFVTAGVGLAIVAVQTPHHVAVALPLLAAGIDVLVEKPLAADVVGAAALVAAAAAPAAADQSATAGPPRGRLFVAHTCRTEATAVAALAALVSAQRSGESAVWRTIEVARAEPEAVQPAGLPAQLLDLLVHDLGIFAPALGEAFIVQTARWDDVIGQLAATLRWADVAVTLTLTLGAIESARSIRVDTAAGAARWFVAPGEQGAAWTPHGGAARPLLLAAEDRDAAVLREVQQARVADRPSPLDGRFGLIAVVIAHAILAAAFAGSAQRASS